MKFMTFNIRTSSLPDKRNPWDKRKQRVIDLVLQQAPDVVGFQEVQQDQLNALVEGLPGYGCHHQGWQANVEKQELLPIFYLKDHVTIARSGAFWLNKTPEIPRLEDGEVLRACTWLHITFLGENKLRTIAVYNSHFDNKKKWLRDFSANLVLDRISCQSSGMPTVFFGDLNMTPGSSAYQLLRARFRDAFLDSPAPRSTNDITCHGFTGVTTRSWYRPTFQWIDYILMDGPLSCNSAARILASPGTKPMLYPSDHWPLMAELVPV